MGGLLAAATVIVKAGSDALFLPSLTLMTMSDAAPAACGVPLRRPVAVLNVAQVGRFVIEKASVSPSLSCALGVRS